MRVDRFLKHVPEIEDMLRDLRPDALVFGMGATGWLLPWIDQRLLAGVRLWTCHDGCRTFKAHDLVLMDCAVRALHPCSERYRHIIDSRPDRIWIYPTAWKSWRDHLDPSVQGIVKVQPFSVWDPTTPPKMLKAKLGRMEMVQAIGEDGKALLQNGRPYKVPTDKIAPDTCAISPTGTTTLAWAQGARRIGILGVDMLPEHGHTSWGSHHQVDAFFCRIADQAHAAGGAIRNLSPITSLQGFKAWKPSASSLEQIVGNGTLEPSLCSITPSESMPPAQSTSLGCAPVTSDGKSAS